MNLCDDGHEEVCFEGRHCPVCSVRGDLKGQMEDLRNQIDRLEKDVENLNNQE